MNILIVEDTNYYFDGIKKILQSESAFAVYPESFEECEYLIALIIDKEYDKAYGELSKINGEIDFFVIDVYLERIIRRSKPMFGVEFAQFILEKQHKEGNKRMTKFLLFSNGYLRDKTILKYKNVEFVSKIDEGRKLYNKIMEKAKEWYQIQTNI